MLKCVVRISLTTPRRSFRCLVPVEHIALVQQCRKRRGADRDCPSALGIRLMARQRKIGIPTTQTIDDIWQRRWRERRNALARGHPDITERALLQQAKRCERVSDQERTALADKLADAANRHLRRAHELSRVASGRALTAEPCYENGYEKWGCSWAALFR